MPGLVPGIHVLLSAEESAWMAGTSPAMTSGGGLPLHAPPIDRRHCELCEFDAVDAADVERHHLSAVGLAAAGEHLDPAVDTELVPDDVLVEEVFLQIFLAGAQHKAGRRHEGEVQALLGADRAVRC